LAAVDRDLLYRATRDAALVERLRELVGELVEPAAERPLGGRGDVPRQAQPAEAGRVAGVGDAEHPLPRTRRRRRRARPGLRREVAARRLLRLAALGRLAAAVSVRGLVRPALLRRRVRLSSAVV